MQYCKPTQSSLDVNTALTFPSSVGALWPSAPVPAWYHSPQSHHSDNCKKMYQKEEYSSEKKKTHLYIQALSKNTKPMLIQFQWGTPEQSCWKHCSDSLKITRRGEHSSCRLSLVPSELCLTARDGPGNISLCLLFLAYFSIRKQKHYLSLNLVRCSS